MKSPSKTFLLTFDLEEFDLPLEFGSDIASEEMLSVTYNGMNSIIPILRNHRIKSTFFSTSIFVENHPKLIKKMVKEGHEIALHAYHHSDDFSMMGNDRSYKMLRDAKKRIERVTKKPILGFRHPRLKDPPIESLKRIGIKYDSSLHPTYIPTRYNNLFRNRQIHKIDGLLEVPISVVPIIRLPFSWIWFRNLGLQYVKNCTQLAARSKGFVNLYFHPWELADIKHFKIPRLFKTNTGRKTSKMLNEYISWAKGNGYKFDTVKNFLNM
jgi:hypothetical protein